ncbi:MAG: hypothetical protein K2L98_04145, partial [Bacilli bacterium]|nr:hypothetical protein [Bacilli bacterium]
MRNVLWYYYQIRCDDIKETDGQTVIITKNGEFIFKELTIPEEILKQIVETLYYRQVPTYLVVLNKDREIITKYNNKPYILLKKTDVLTKEFIDFTNIEVKQDKNNIGLIWSNKIDYYMLQLKEFGIKKEVLINSFNYYVGMAENAIAMANRVNANNNEFKYVIQHARLKFPLNREKYYDPTTMVIDIRIRDLSEYIKSKFFSESINIE